MDPGCPRAADPPASRGASLQPRESVRVLHFKPPGGDVDKRTGVATPVSADTDSPTPGHDPGKPGDRPSAWSSLASKLILFVFASTFITATVVSWITIQSTSRSLREVIERLYPLSLDHAAQRIEPWVCAIRLQLEYNTRRRAAQPSVLAGLRDREMLDGLALYNRGGALPSRGALRAPGLGGEPVIAATQPVAVLDWNVAIIAPFETAYAPVFSVVKRVFAIDLCIILAFSLIAYRITARVVRPIGHLSEAVRRVM